MPVGGDCLAFIEIHGPCRIQGGLTVQGSKNAVLPIMAASVLNRGITVLENVPRIQDVFCMMGILDSLGCRCALHGNRLEIDTSKMNGWRIEQKAMGKMRSSIMLLGALLGLSLIHICPVSEDFRIWREDGHRPSGRGVRSDLSGIQYGSGFSGDQRIWTEL